MKPALENESHCQCIELTVPQETSAQTYPGIGLQIFEQQSQIGIACCATLIDPLSFLTLALGPQKVLP